METRFCLSRYLSGIIHDISNNRILSAHRRHVTSTAFQKPMRKVAQRSWDPAEKNSTKCLTPAICAFQLMSEKGDPLEGNFCTKDSPPDTF